MTTESANTPQINPPPGTTAVVNVSLEAFEAAVYRPQIVMMPGGVAKRDRETAGRLLLESLRKLKSGAEFIGYQPVPAIKKILYTRFCAAVIALFADPEFGLSKEGFDVMAAEHAVMDLLFRASAFTTSDHLLPQLSDVPTETDRTKMKVTNGPNLAKFLLTYSLRSGFHMQFEKVFAENKVMVYSLWIGMLSALLTINAEAQEKREILLGLHTIFEDMDIPEAVMPSLSDAYMYSSYGIRRDKHDVKGMIHRGFARMLKKHGVAIPTEQQLHDRRVRALARTGKPTMLVCVEWFTSLHAMYRCYAPIIRQLRTRFHLVGMCRITDIDDVGIAEFDELHPIPAERLVMGEIAAKINEIEPDLIYHPSVGMALWWTVLSSVRLAPIQFMTMGHPASSRSPEMDYMLCDEGVVGDESLFTEKLIYYPHGSARFVMRSDAVFPERKTVLHPETIHIAVPAMLCKLTAPFLQTLQRIQMQAQKPVVFHFFVNMIGVNLHQAAAEIHEYLPTAKVYERNQYAGYLAHLNECHIHCSTFPFGGTNSNIDSMKLGIPIVTLWGDEPHERYDGMMLRRAGMPDWLIAHTKDEYVETTLALIHDDEVRNDLRDCLASIDMDAIFFGDPPEDQRTAIVDLVWDLFINHEERRHE